MRVIPTRIHGIIDYLWGAALIASPYVLGFSGDVVATTIAWVFGLGAIAYSLLTDYELGVVRLVPMGLHLAFDAAAGGLLALLPVFMRLDGRAAWTFALFGLFSLAAGFLTRTEPGSRRAGLR